MTITAIKAQARNPERVSVYVDGRYAFSLTHSQLLEHRLHSGKELSADEIAGLKQASDYGKLLERTMNFVMIRPRSIKEVRDYLWRKKADPELATKVTAYLQNRGYIDDANFAKSWAHARQLTKPVSQRRLVAELRQKGVPTDAINQALTQVGYDEHAALREIIAKKRRQARYQDDQRLMQYLARQGFGYDSIRNALDASLELEGNE